MTALALAQRAVDRLWRAGNAPPRRKGDEITTSPELDAFLRLGLGAVADSGITVTADTALKCMAVYSAVRVLSETVGQIPLILYKRTEDGGKRRAVEHPLYPLLHDGPSAEQTSIEFREMMQGHLSLRGNAFAFINRVRDGTVVKEIRPLHPNRVTPVQADDWTVTYKVRRKSGEEVTYGGDQILHLRGLSSDGVVGLSPISLMRESVGLALGMEKHGAKLFARGAHLDGILSHPQTLNEEVAKRISASFRDAYSGLENIGKTAVLEEGMTWTKVGMTSEDAQFLASRKFQIGDIARAFRMPPHMIGDLEKATFSNIEQQSLEFVMYTMMPWFVRWEQRLNWSLLSPEERGVYFFEFLVDGLLRGDSKTRAGVFHTLLLDGVMSPNEVRVLLNLNPREGGDVFYTPLNVGLMGGSAGDEDAANEQRARAILLRLVGAGGPD